jgi:hypothetical protein
MIEVSCKQCERIHTPSRDDFRRGVWRICASCRGGPEPAGIRSHDDPGETLSGANNAPKMSSSADRQGETAA